MKKIAIIGGGPSGIFCAYKLLSKIENLDITIFEKSKPLSTLLVTGNGRCNITYNENDYKILASNYPRGEKFLYSIFSRYGIYETLSDFKNLDIETYVQKDNRIFPISNKASEVRYKLLSNIDKKVKFVFQNIDSILTGYDIIILATGLKSGAKVAELYGHEIIPLKSSLTGLKIKEDFSKIEGVSFNDIIFTKNGVSGPFIYKLSSINAYKEFPYEIKIPLINIDELKNEVKSNPKKLFKTIVSNFIPKSLANILVKDEKQCANVSNNEIKELEFLNLTAVDKDNKGEIVHAGGVSLLEVDKNLKSKINKNVWIIGELLDIDGFTGGFNLQNCWSTASIAALDIAEKIKLNEL